MAFLSDIPQSTDQLSISQGNILNNFGILGAIAGNINAGSASINNTSGFNFINLPVNSIPPVVFPAGNIGLYAGLNPTTSQNELYINKTNQATVTQIPATASILSITSAPASGTAGWTYLPSGLIIQWGKSSVGGSGIAGSSAFGKVNFPINFPNQCLNVTFTTQNPNNGITNSKLYLTSFDSIGFFGYADGPNSGSAGSPFQVTFFAIGY